MVPIFLTQINLALTVNPQSFNFSSHVTLTLSPFYDTHFCFSVETGQGFGEGMWLPVTLSVPR